MTCKTRPRRTARVRRRSRASSGACSSGAGLSLGALTLLSGCDAHRRRRRAEGAVGRCRAGTTACRRGCSIPNRLAPEYPGERDHQAVSVQRLLRRGRGAAGRRGRLPARALRAWSGRRSRGRCPSSTRCRRYRRSRATSASKAGARSASGAACAFRDFPAAHRRRPDGQVRRLQVRRRLLHQHRHGDRAASADAARRCASPTRSCRRSTDFR